MSRDSLILYLARKGVADKMETIVRCLDKNLRAPKIEENDNTVFNPLDRTYLHGYTLREIWDALTPKHKK